MVVLIIAMIIKLMASASPELHHFTLIELLSINYVNDITYVLPSLTGQVGNVITNRNASRQEFERLLVSVHISPAS